MRPVIETKPLQYPYKHSHIRAECNLRKPFLSLISPLSHEVYWFRIAKEKINGQAGKKKVACGTFVLRSNKEKPEKLTAKLNGNLIALALHSVFELHPWATAAKSHELGT